MKTVDFCNINCCFSLREDMTEIIRSLYAFSAHSVQFPDHTEKSFSTYASQSHAMSELF